MERDLNALLRSVADTHEQALGGVEPTGAFQRARRAVRRRRVVRHTQTAALGVAAVAVVGGAAVLVGQSRATPVDPATRSATPTVSTPTTSPTATPSVTPSAGPTSDPTPTGEATQVEVPLVTGVAGVPPHRALTAQVAAQVGPGWVASVHRTGSAPAGVVDEMLSRTGNVVLLTSPDGRSYRVPLDEDAFVAVSWWVAGQPLHVDAYPGGEYGPPTPMLLDPVAGTLTAADGDWRLVGRDADGGTVLTDGRSVVVVDADGGRRTVLSAEHVLVGGGMDPTGHRVAVRVQGSISPVEVVDVATGRSRALEPAAAGSCEVGGWLDATTLLYVCDTSGTTVEHELDVETGAVQEVRRGASSVDWARGVGVGDGSVVSEPPVSDDCGAGSLVRRGRDGTVSTLVDYGSTGVTGRYAVVGGTLYVGLYDCADQVAGAGGVTVVDPATGATVRTVVPQTPADVGGNVGPSTWTVAR